MERTPQHSAALEAADRGWHVFPVLAGRKEPAIERWEDRATTDLRTIERHWGTGRRDNVGIACGPSKLYVVDLDTAGDADVPPEYEGTRIRSGADVLADLEGARGEIPDTFEVATPSGGQHRYFAAPEGVELGNTAGRLGWKIDTRGQGGFVVAPGSRITGKPDPYRVTADREVAQLPGWMRQELENNTPARRAVAAMPADQRQRSDYVAAAIRGELARVLSQQNLAARSVGPDQPGPGRNHSLYQASSQLGQLVASGELDPAVAHAMLAAAGEATGLTPLEANRTVASGLRNGANAPRQREQVQVRADTRETRAAAPRAKTQARRERIERQTQTEVESYDTHAGVHSPKAASRGQAAGL